ncbi:MAG: hypothetical protein ACE5GW_06085, partial [Planctomycetota bacterium]
MKSNRSGGDSVLKGGASIGFVILMSVALLGPGCAGGSSDAIQGILNTTGPRVTQVQYIDVDGNGVDENDLLVVTFEKAITISSTSAGAFGFDNILDSLGSAPTISQSIPRSDKVEILLGSGADLVPGASILDILSGGLINIEDLTGVDARAASVLVTVSDFTATAPTLLSTFYNDADLDGTMNVGDTLLCVFDKPVTIPVGQTVAGNFSVPVTGDSLGAGVSMTLFSEGPGNCGVLITLGTSPILTVNGTFDVGVVGAGSPSGIAMVALPGITDTLASGAQAVTGNTVVDLAPLGASFFRILQAGTLFPDNIDSTASDVSPNGF